MIQVIPSIAIRKGRVVKMRKGDPTSEKAYDENPLDLAKRFEDHGIEVVHLVDLDGARQGSVKNWNVLETLASKTSLQIDFGGGIQTEKDVRIVLDSGASLVTIGSMAVKEGNTFQTWLDQFGAALFFLGADVKQQNITISGWQEDTKISVFDFLGKYADKGIHSVFCTDVSKDRALQGPSFDLYKDILSRLPQLKLVASGGVSSLDDLYRLEETGCCGAIVGKAIYEGRIALKDLEKFNN